MPTTISLGDVYQPAIDTGDPNNHAADVPPNVAGAIADYYKLYLGRQASPAEINAWISVYSSLPTGQHPLDELKSRISSSPEAQAYARSHPAPTGSGSSSSGSSAHPYPNIPTTGSLVDRAQAVFQEWLKENPSPTSASLDQLLAALKANGIDASRATHAGNQPSDDKIQLSDGTIIDTIQSVGGPDAKWYWGAQSGGSGGGTDTTAATGPMTYEQAVARANQIAQQYLGRNLTTAEVNTYLAKYGGGPGTSVTQAGLSPILLDIMSKKGGASGGGGTTNTRAPFQGLASDWSGGYNDALTQVQNAAQQYLGRKLTDAELDQLKQKYGFVADTAGTPGALLKGTRLDPKQSGTGQQALDYLNSESVRLRGTPLSQNEIAQAQKLIGYQEGQPVTGAQVNTLLDQLDTLATNKSAGTTGNARTYTANDLNPVLQDLYGRGAGTGGGGGGGGGGGTNGDPYGLASYLTSSPLLAPWTEKFETPDWVPPTALTAENDPGMKERMALGQQAVERSAAAKGTLLTGGTLKDLTDYGQTFGSNEFQNVYNRSLNDWTTNYNKASQQYAQAYNIFENNQAKQYNRIANLAGLGQVAAGQLGSQSLGYSNANTGASGSLGSNLANLLTGIGNAQAAGTIGSANASSAGASNLGSSLYGLASLFNNRNSNTGSGDSGVAF